MSVALTDAGADGARAPVGAVGVLPPTGNGEDIRIASRSLPDGLLRTELSVPGMHCAGCMRTIERALSALAGVEYARVNLSTRRVAVHWRAAGTPPPLLATLEATGYEAHLLEDSPQTQDKEFGRLVRALAVAGFCALNIMLFSVSIWAGADAQMRNVFHWISAALALPALVYSGRIFFASAWSVVRRGHTNMDVPISIGVLLAFGLSLYDTILGGAQAYFDASVTLLFFLLIGRTLDHVMRERARLAVSGLSRLAPRGAHVLRPDGTSVYLPLSDIETGMRIAIAAGERVPVDAEVEAGTSDLDCSVVSGESTPTAVAPGAVVRAGTLNLTGALTLRALAAADDSFLAEMVRLMEVAEGGRARYRRIADRVSRFYAPVVHLAATATFIGWMLATGDWHRAISIAIAVLIITCPCALGLAVPMVQVMAARRLFEQGILVKDGTAMERLAEADAVVFDKTGTLTTGRPHLVNRDAIELRHLHLAAAIAAHSRHPLSRCLAAFAVPAGGPDFLGVSENPGNGLEARTETAVYRLGRAGWALSGAPAGAATPATVLARDGDLLAAFAFEDQARADAAETVAELRRRGYHLSMLSGDHAAVVAPLAGELGLADYAAEVLPARKVARIEALRAAGRRVLMVGDGLNDAPALAAAHVSMAPAEAADVGRNAADFVFLRKRLGAILDAIGIARASARLIRQNIAFAIGYNAIAVPVAALGYVTPLIAALAMSLSSIIVVANALRLRAPAAPAAESPAHPAAAILGPAE